MTVNLRNPLLASQIHLWALCLLLFLASIPLFAQSVSSELLGVVTDPSGAPVADAVLTATNDGTQAQRESRSAPDGSFHIPGLAPGAYQLRVQHPGFTTLLLNAVQVPVDQRAVVNCRLELGAMRQVMEVKAQPSVLETAGSNLSGLVDRVQVSELPLNGRDVFQLTEIQPGVTPTTNAGPNPWSNSGFTKASVNGTRPTMNNINIDGGDVNDPGFNIPPGGVAGVQLGLESIREFRVLLNGYDAAFGRNAGANVQLITKSGTNHLQGSFYEYLRNSKLDARNFFDGSPIPLFIRNQFGASAGGPLRRDRTFFFLNYEGLRERQSVTSTASVPDNQARQGLLPSAANPAVLVNVGVDRRIAPFLNLFPVANGPDLGGGLALLSATGSQPAREDYGLGRLDQQIGSRDDVFARYIIDDSNATVPFLSTYLPGFAGAQRVRNQYAMLSWQHTFSPNLWNELKFDFNRTSYLSKAADTYPLSISLLGGQPLGTIDITGLPALGNSVAFPFGSTSNVYEVIDNAFRGTGKHLLRFGTDIKREQINSLFNLFSAGDYGFSDLTPFGLTSQSNNPALEAFLRATPFDYVGVDPANANSDRGFRQNYLSFYLQDDYRASSHLTFNLGLRWEYWSNPGEAHDRLANIRDVISDSAPTPGNIWASVPLNLWSPRIGFAWNPAGSRKTVVRGAFGILRDQIWANLYADVRFYEPYYRPLLYVLPPFLAPPPNTQSLVGGGGPPGVIGSFGVTYRPSFPYYLEYNLNVQQELTPNLLLQVAYVGSRGMHLARTGEANPFVASLGSRINPNFGSIPLIVTDAQSDYNSGQISLRRRLSGGLVAQTSYTYSKAIDDQSGAFPSDFTSESGVAQDLFDRTGDRARSSFDRTHVFVGSWVYELPFGRGRAYSLPRWANGVLGRWSLSGVVSAYSGLPFTPNLGSFNNSGNLASNVADRPNLKPGARPCGNILGQPSDWYNAAIFTLPAAGQYGNAGRNILCGPPLVNLDLAAIKEVALTERVHLQFRAEFFNAANHANFDNPINTQGPNGNGGNGDAVFIGRRSFLPDGLPCTLGNDPASLGCGILAPNVGRIFRTVTPSREIQFALKLVF